MLSSSVWFSAPSLWMDGGLGSRCVGCVCGADVAARHRPHRKHDLRSDAQDHHPSTNSVQKTICCNSTSNAPDDGRMRPKHAELRIYQWNYLVASSWHFTLFHTFSFSDFKQILFFSKACINHFPNATCQKNSFSGAQVFYSDEGRTEIRELIVYFTQNSD